MDLRYPCFVPRFIPCPSCEQHVKLTESACPHCGGKLRDGTGAVLKTATAAVLGLAAATASCGDEVAEYGPAPTTDAASTTAATGGGGGAGGAGQAGMGGEPVAEYGPAPTTGAGGN